MSQGNADGRATGQAFKIHSAAAGNSPKPRGKRRNGPVTTTRLSALAEEIALFLADGDRNRFRVISVTTVIVVNNPGRRR